MSIQIPENALYKADGSERRVGVEIELSGIHIDKLVTLTHHRFGGRVKPVTSFEALIENTRFGTFKIELDQTDLKQLGRDLRAQNNRLADDIESLAGDLSLAMLKNIVPLEIVTPPIPFSQLPSLDALVTDLRSEGAKGTHESLIYAFGLHFNPELPDLEPHTLLHYMQAFACLQDWLVSVERPDISRRVTPYIDPWPKEYCRLLTHPDYNPDLGTLMGDYIQNNPTRNRTLDMLPMIRWLDEPLLLSKLKDARIGKRPTLHYRLPNSDISNPEWTPGVSWQYWLQVELLANNPEHLKDMCRHYHHQLGKVGLELLDPWKEKSLMWLHQDH
jgi:hypothetical protein